jgi:hypothetical protein
MKLSTQSRQLHVAGGIHNTIRKGADFCSFKKSLRLFIFHKRKNFKGKKKAKTVVTII